MLSKNEQEILNMRYGLNDTFHFKYKDIAKKLAMSVWDVKNLEENAIWKLYGIYLENE